MVVFDLPLSPKILKKKDELRNRCADFESHAINGCRKNCGADQVSKVSNQKEDDIYFLIQNTIVLTKSQKLLSQKISKIPKGIFFQKLNSMLQQDRFGESIYPCNVSSLLLFRRLMRF